MLTRSMTRPLIVLAFLALLTTKSFASEPRFMTRADHYAMIMKARADMMRAQAEIIKAQAELMKAQAQARTAYYEAAKTRQSVSALSMDNQLKRVETHFRKKSLRREFLQRQSESRKNHTSEPSRIGAEALAIAAR